jgi:hypothetical protein
MNTQYPFDDLKKICNDLKVDLKTRKIAYGLHKTNHRVAYEYALGYPLRHYVETMQAKEW